ncbi:hypothetical protein CFP65_6649 [Kitasatospora sp. MMS16-BH015]|uniref:SHOCT domain-containing protein n=1 Tax=Kitasatospora sp. MMS16-BH015 TaxID=2018025 RepID=UPI000CA3E8B8|nr:SHOCT domain-containing protein [Kitasatospora sp. MMS16-BH015]AUG81296.1 hypothetical protein CFP65_6649 [Kitasatospora sp. MMS16-BH015]
MDWSDLLGDVAADVLRKGDGERERLVDAARAEALPGERPLAMTAARGKDDFLKGVLLLTSARLLYLKEGRPAVSVPLPGVVDAALSSTRLSGKVLKVTALTGAHRWEGLENAEEFTKHLHAAIASADRAQPLATDTAPAVLSAPAPTPDHAPAAELLDLLERLAALRTAGALDEAEFAAAKRKLLGT